MVSNDNWFKTHLVVWTRKTRGDSSGIDDPVLTDSTGFPKNIKGYFEFFSGDRITGNRGVEINIVASFYTTEIGILANDYITYNNKTYIVQNSIPQNDVNNTIDHYECLLVYES